MFAVIKTGGKQYRVAADELITVERLDHEDGASVVFEALLVGGGEEGTLVGAPFVEGARVSAEVVRQARGPKVIAFKKRRRQNSRRKRGHRQDLTVLRISEIATPGGSSRGRGTEAAAPVESASPSAG